MIFPKTLATVMASMAALATVAAGKDSRTFAVLHFHGSGPLTQGRSDPIVNPGGPSTHSHAIQGANAFGNSATGESLQESTCSTADIKADKSAYWMPTVYFHDTANNSFEAVPLFYMNVYYFFEATNDDIKSFPLGLQMVSGDSKKTTPPASGDLVLDPSKGTIQPAQFTCPRTSFDPPSWPADSDGTEAGMQDSGNEGSGVGFPFANCDGYASPLRADLHFPSCYDPSKELTDYKNNMAFPSDAGDGKSDCPEGWIHTPHIFYEMYWNTPLFVDRWTPNGDSQPFVLSNGDAAGYSLHGDFIAGWDEDVLQHIIDTCDAGDAGMDQCSGVETVMEGDCSIPNPTPEQIDGSLEKLPGTNPLFGWAYGTSGSTATSAAASSSAASSTKASSSSKASTATTAAVSAAESSTSSAVKYASSSSATKAASSSSSSATVTPNTSGPTYSYGSNPTMPIVSSVSSSSSSASAAYTAAASSAAASSSASSTTPESAYRYTTQGKKAKATSSAAGTAPLSSTGASGASGSASASYTRPVLSYSSAPFANVSSSAAGSSSAPAATTSTPASGASSTPASGGDSGSGSGSSSVPDDSATSGYASACSGASTTTVTATETATETATVTAGADSSASGSGSDDSTTTVTATAHLTTTRYVTKSRSKTSATASSSASAGYSVPSAAPSASSPSYGNSTQFKRDDAVYRNRIVRRASECSAVTVTVTATETAFTTATVTAAGSGTTTTGVDGTRTVTTHRTSTHYVTIPQETTHYTVTPSAGSGSAATSVEASSTASSSVSALPSASASGSGTYGNGTDTHYKRAHFAHHHRHVRTHLH